MNGDDLSTIAEREDAAWRGHNCRVAVCSAAGCLSSGSAAVRGAIDASIAAAGAASATRVIGTGCLGLCHAGPLVSVENSAHGSILYERVTPEIASAIVTSHVLGGPPVPEHQSQSANAFFQKQERIVLANAGRIDSERIEDYIGAGGYQALQLALTERTPAEIVNEIVASGLRGRGGGGYPAGLKWSTVAKARGTRKFVICNGDEGDPGAFMDRSVLEGDPHRVIEGMAIAGYAVGASQGYIYVRGEYPLAINRLKTAIRQAERLQLLGNRICDSSFNFRIDLRIGAGAFVCGEETALIASIEGRRGAPRPRPPYPAETGLWREPTLINNVETLASVAPIVLRGGAWYAGIGTPKSKGTKVFALAGRINRTGLIEVPMGITLREIIYDIGGGIPGGRAFKAAQTGGPSGGCIPAQFLDLPVDYESLAGVGSIMGSGGLIVMDETSCMVDVARFFVDFCRDESCGKCVPCRAGTAALHALLTRITEGRATEAELGELERLCATLRDTSLCGLGQTAPNPVISTLHHFREEYLAHILDRRCPAGVCRMGA